MIKSTFDVKDGHAYRYQLTLTDGELSSVLLALKYRLDQFNTEGLLETAHPDSYIGKIQRTVEVLDRAVHGCFPAPDRCRLVYKGQKYEVR